MRIAVLSDIHCNIYALRSVLAEAALVEPEIYVIAGDVFGYYPWAVETWEAIRRLPLLAVRGNHDEILLSNHRDNARGYIYEIAEANRTSLLDRAPEALSWLESLPLIQAVALSGVEVRIAHGTPTQPLTGRFYPDAEDRPVWTPPAQTVQLLGHTHWPLVKSGTGLIANPGSVGQPRDGDERASWGLLSLPDMSFSIQRTVYDRESAIRHLQQMDWHASAIKALNRHG